MGDAIKISFQIILLIIIMGTIGALLGSQNTTIQTIGEDLIKNKNDVMQVELSTGNVETFTSNRNIVTDKSVKDIDKTGTLVVLVDGNAYAVQGGVVLVDGRVISVDEEQSSVYNVDNPEFSVSSD